MLIINNVDQKKAKVKNNRIGEIWYCIISVSAFNYIFLLFIFLFPYKVLIRTLIYSISIYL